ncbi:MAG: FAD-dependent oxidoreductase [Candidatus Poseidoniaceae archaeon]
MFDLPEHLSERCKLANSNNELNGQGPVVVWLKSSLRTHENPALDAGRIIAAQFNRALLVYQGIDERYPHANARHHNILFDAAIDMHHGCQQLGIDYVLHVAREGHRPSIMKEFATTASLIITDLFPLPPWKHWVHRIASEAQCPVIEIDCHCVVPMPVFGKSVDRPFRYRDATKKLRKRRVGASWPILDIEAPQSWHGKLPFNPVDIATLSSPNQRLALLRTCNIDMSVHPVWEQRGGERAALNRWQDFLSNRLSGYARRRNNAADPEGVSRLSMAIHYGMISVMKIVREAHEVGTKAAEKFLDELLIFREHAWHHVYSKEEPYGSHNLPNWALESWRDTSDDVRTTLLSKEGFELGNSPNHLWNLCQTSLYRHGELHNNLRMTWGKATPHWTPAMEDSLNIGQHLNDKFALDGRDPSSIAGIHWCHGLFDRAFLPPLPVMGVVRKRELETHQSRLDMETYERHVTRLAYQQERPFVIVGAGFAGARAAQILTNYGYDVLVLDKGTIPGGRTSTKRRETGAYNHGCDALDGELYADLSITEMLDGTDVRCDTRIVSIESKSDHVLLEDEKGFTWEAEAVILTCPIPQLYKLMEGRVPSEWKEHPYISNWTLICTGRSPVTTRLLGYTSDSIDLIRKGIDHEESNVLIVQMENKWSKKHLEKSRDEVTDLIRQEIQSVDQDWLESAVHHAHRWRFSRPTSQPKAIDDDRITFAGDAWAEPIGTVQAALKSAEQAALELIWKRHYAKKQQKSISVQTTLF